MAACAACGAMGGDEAMAVIGIGANSRAAAGDVLAIIAAARAIMAEGGAGTSPSPLPLSHEGRGECAPEHGTSFKQARPAPSPLAGEGWGEGEPLIAAVATLSRATTDSILQEAADRAGLNLILLTLNELRGFAHLCQTHSEQSMKRYGIPSVAEAAALAGAGAGATLLVPRIKGRNATASIAALP